MAKLTINGPHPGKSGEPTYTMAGALTEDAGIALDALATTLAGKVTFNFSRISGVNSLGVRSWMQFIRRLPADVDLNLTEVSAHFIHQVNLIPGLRSRITINSVMTPYVCPDCHREEPVLHELKPKAKAPKAPTCQTCGTLMHVTDEDEYFAFQE